MAGRPKPLIVFAHGAGMPSSSPWMQAWAARLEAATSACAVHTFDYSYVTAGRPAPKAETLVAQHAEQVRTAAAAQRTGTPVILAGKSMGSRVGLHAAAAHAAELNVVGAVCFGYPLIGASGAVRDAVLADVPVPVLFVQGTKDSMCPLDRLQGLVDGLPMRAGTRIVAVDGGDHSLLVGKKALTAAGKTQEDVDARIADEVTSFAAGVLASAGKGIGGRAATTGKASSARASGHATLGAGITALKAKKRATPKAAPAAEAHSAASGKRVVKKPVNARKGADTATRATGGGALGKGTVGGRPDDRNTSNAGGNRKRARPETAEASGSAGEAAPGADLQARGRAAAARGGGRQSGSAHDTASTSRPAKRVRR
jgi:predicted alpha/beta-hydrolase family hydrolase